VIEVLVFLAIAAILVALDRHFNDERRDARRRNQARKRKW
jgi:hypothetical protein